MAVSAALPGIVNQHLPVQALIFGIIISQKIIKGIASAQNIGAVVHYNIFIMHPALALPGGKQVDGIVYFNPDIGMGGYRVK